MESTQLEELATNPSPKEKLYLEPAGKGKRTVAFFIDCGFQVLFYSIVFLVLSTTFLLSYASLQGEALKTMELVGQLVRLGIWTFVLAPVLQFLIIPLAEGQTPGKCFCDIAIRKLDGSKVRFWTLLGRTLSFSIFFWITVPWTLFSPSGRGLHDRLFGTRVVSKDDHWESELATAMTWKRVLSFMVDTLLSAIIAVVGTLFFTPFLLAVLPESTPRTVVYIIVPIFLILIPAIWFIMHEVIGGRTPGKWITGTAVRSADGSPLTFKQLVIRSATRLIPLNPFSILFSWKRKSTDPSPEWWHDRWSKSRVFAVAPRPWLDARWREFWTFFKPAPWKRGSLFYELLLYPGIWVPLLLLGMATIAWGGRKFGVPLLFWHDNEWVALFAGIFLGLTLGWGLFLFFSLNYSKWLDRRAEIENWAKEKFTDSERAAFKEKSRETSASPDEFRDYLPSSEHWTNRLYAYYREESEKNIYQAGVEGENETSQTEEVLGNLHLRSYLFRMLTKCAAILVVLVFLTRLGYLVFRQVLFTDTLPNLVSEVFSEKEGLEKLQASLAQLGAIGESIRYWEFSWWIFPMGWMIGILLVLFLDKVKFRFIGKIALLMQYLGKSPGGDSRARERKHMYVMALYGVIILLTLHLALLILSELGVFHLAAPAICVAAGWAMLLYAGVTFLLRRLDRLVVIGVVIAFFLLMLGPWLAQHRRYGFWDLETAGRNLYPIRESHVGDSSPATVNRREGELIFRDPTASGKYLPAEWNNGSAPDENQPLVIICASGGGITAEVWAIQVLDALNKLDGFTDHIRIVTGASGGMVGASAWVAQQSDRWDNHLSQLSPSKLTDRCQRDQLSPAALRWALCDVTVFGLAQRFPLFRHSDRGNALESTWVGRRSKDRDGKVRFTIPSDREKPAPSLILPELRVTLGDLAAEERRGTCPSLIYAPMIAEDGRQFLVSNLDLSRLKTVSAHSKRNFKFKDQIHVAVEAGEILGIDTVARQPISSWARMNATFPFVSPAGTLDVAPKNSPAKRAVRRKQKNLVLHLVDAAYADNYGTSTAVNWLREYWVPWLKEKQSNAPRKVILIELDAYPRYGYQSWAFQEPSSDVALKNFRKVTGLFSTAGRQGGKNRCGACRRQNGVPGDSQCGEVCSRYHGRRNLARRSDQRSRRSHQSQSQFRFSE